MLPSLLLSRFFFLITFYFLLLSLPRYVASDDQSLSYTACTPFDCGEFPHVTYPFWGNGRPDYCGHPKFKLDCEEGNMTINIASQTFHVIYITFTTRTLQIARVDLWGSKCPKEYTNVNLDFAVFNYTSNDDNSTLSYDCDGDPLPASLPKLNFTCPINRSVLREAYFVISTSWRNVSALGCKISMTVPVLVRAIQSYIKNALDVGYVLDQGFEIRWDADDARCEECIESGGRCGYNVSVNDFRCFCPNQTYFRTCLPDGENANIADKPRNWQRKTILGVTGGAIGALLICIAIFYFGSKSGILQPEFWNTTKDHQDIEAFIRNHGPLAPKRYKFSDVKKMTNSFKVKLGQGGYGTVYKGKLLTGCPVAVKILNASKGNGEEFVNEVASISRTSHVNVVTLVGFCFERHKKALIYEFMPNGSLEKFIYDKVAETTPSLTWENLYQIAIGIARGLEYLHRGCNTRILHFDIKPHNILLDENFCPKISDFGLAKLCPRKDSIISMSDARGTIGYVAPEVWNRSLGGVSHKSDVYSYGMMLLEMVGGRKNINAEASHTSEIYFPHYVYDKLEQGTNLGVDGILTMEENDIVKRMTVVGLWCIQTIPNYRPTISGVIEMLEGSIDSLEMPPKPVLSSPTRSSVPESSTALNSLQSIY